MASSGWLHRTTRSPPPNTTNAECRNANASATRKKVTKIPWFKVDDNLAFHAKTMKAGNSAMGLWVRAGSWAAHQLTDGFVPDHMCTTLGTRAQAHKLVGAGLWRREDGGFRFHEWTDRQPSRAEVEAERDASKERMRRARAQRKGTAKSEEKPQKSESSQVSEPRSDEQNRSFGRSSPEVRAKLRQPDPVPVPVPVPTQSPYISADDWTPTDKHRALAAQQGVNADDQAERFRDYIAANGKKYKSLDRAFNNWLKNANQFGGRQTRQQEVDGVYERAMQRGEQPL